MKNKLFDKKDFEYESSIDFVKELNFTNEEIELNLIKIRQINNDLNECKNSNLDKCIHLDQEHEVFFRNKYNKLRTTYVKCLKHKNNFDSNYLIKDFDKNLLKIQFLNANIDTKNKNKNYRSEIIKELKSQHINNLYRNLFLYGKIGVGKTYIITLFCNFLATKNKTISFVNMNNFVSKFKESNNIYRLSDNFMNMIKKMSDSDVLVIDELGIESFSNKLHVEILIPLLFDRNLNNKTTYFISNYDLKKLKLKYQNLINNFYYKNTDIKNFDLMNIDKFIQQIYILVKQNIINLEGENWIQKDYYDNR